MRSASPNDTATTPEQIVQEFLPGKPVDVDLFSTPEGWSILEVNPRFGGVYPHAYECGVEFPSLLLNNVEGRANEPRIGDYESGWAMLGYDGVVMHRVEGLSQR